MFDNLVVQLGPWSWWVLGLVLLAAELVLPGFFLIWVGLAGIIVGALSLLFWDSAFWVWQVQWLIFAASAVIVTLLGRHYVYNNSQATDEPFLNQRSASLVGRTATLAEPIIEGAAASVWRIPIGSWPGRICRPAPASRSSPATGAT